jgi:hypothetical protein
MIQAAAVRSAFTGIDAGYRLRLSHLPCCVAPYDGRYRRKDHYVPQAPLHRAGGRFL